VGPGADGGLGAAGEDGDGLRVGEGHVSHGDTRL
jgi:hypothetical protein